MNNFEQLKAMAFEEFAEWLDKNCVFDSAPWTKWFAENYCDKCEAIKCKYDRAEELLGITSHRSEIECAYCELEKTCKFFQDLDDIPNSLETIKMWLMEEYR